MFNKKNKETEKMFYRLRKNSIDTKNEAFSYTNDANDLKEIIEKFINENDYFSIINNNAIAEEVYGKSGVVLNAKTEILELDQKIYRNFKDEIEKKLNMYEQNVIKSFGISNETKLSVGIFTSSIETEKIICDYQSKIDVAMDIKSIKFNRVNNYDMQLLNYILEAFLETKQQQAKIEHIDNNEFYLVCEDGKLLFDFYAYDIVVDKVKEHNKNLARENQSSLKK